jgi:hypothetical protein
VPKRKEVAMNQCQWCDAPAVFDVKKTYSAVPGWKTCRRHISAAFIFAMESGEKTEWIVERLK